MITFLHGAKFIRILKRRCKVCGKKKRNYCFDSEKDTLPSCTWSVWFASGKPPRRSGKGKIQQKLLMIIARSRSTRELSGD